MFTLLTLVLYLTCVLVAALFLKKGIDKEKIVTFKEKLLILIWFTCFISSQFVLIDWVFRKLNVF